MEVFRPLNVYAVLSSAYNRLLVLNLTWVPSWDMVSKSEVGKWAFNMVPFTNLRPYVVSGK